jgi:3-oxo-5-alpha-steroid 4-dehydrogenase 1
VSELGHYWKRRFDTLGGHCLGPDFGNAQAHWLNDIYEPVLWLYLTMTIATFIALWWIAAPYGRFARKGFGPQISAMAGWMTMELPVVFAFPAYFFVAGGDLGVVSAVFAAMFLSHYVHRTFIYPVRRRDPSAMIPVLLVVLAIFFNLINGFSNAWFVFARMTYDVSWLMGPKFVIGFCVFLAGMIINMHSDRVLLRLKRQGKGYQVPQEGLHRWVASPNYFGEIVEWTGWAIATWSPAGALFALYTIANLAPRARSNLRWYHETFPDYPASRKALIPRVW